MPAAAVVEVLVQVFGEIFAQLVTESAWAVGKAVVGEVREAHEKQRELARAQVLAGADLLVLAAAHDHVVTEAERAELARVLPPVFARAEVEITMEELLDRWSERRQSISSDDELRRIIASTASVLTPRQRRRVVEAVAALVKADAIAERPGVGPMRAAGSKSKADTVRIFSEALG